METSYPIRKILMSADTIGGVWTYALDLCRLFDDAGIEVALATMGRPLSTAQWREVRQVPNVRVFPSSYKLEWMDAPWRDVEEAADWLLQLEEEIDPDVIHLNHFAHGALPWKSPVVLVGHSCVFSWHQHVRRETPSEKWQPYRRVVSHALQAADAVVAPSFAMLRDLDRFYGPLRRTRMIPNTRIASRFYPRSKEEFIFSSGRIWDDAKNMQALSAVAGRLAWPVYLAGDTCAPGGDEVGGGDARCLGPLPVDALSRRMGAASIYALPARYEPFGLSVLEAALSGCALVLGDINSLRENWDGAARFVDPDDSDEICNALKTLVNDPQRLTRMMMLARRRASRFAPERTQNAYLHLYRQLYAASFSEEPDTAVLLQHY